MGKALGNTIVTVLAVILLCRSLEMWSNQEAKQEGSARNTAQRIAVHLQHKAKSMLL
jgi:hypothetical protein